MYEVARVCEPFEGAFPAAQQYRGEDIRELVDVAAGEGLADDVGAAMTCTSFPPATSSARTIALAMLPTNVKSSPDGFSTGWCVTTKNGTPHGLLSPQCPPASYVHRPPITMPVPAIAASSHSLSCPAD